MQCFGKEGAIQNIQQFFMLLHCNYIASEGQFGFQMGRYGNRTNFNLGNLRGASADWCFVVIKYKSYHDQKQEPC